MTSENKQTDIREKALKLYKPPFKYINGYIHDSKGCVVADDDNVKETVVTRIRGWGKLVYLAEAEKLQDEIGLMVAEALNDYWNKHK